MMSGKESEPHSVKRLHMIPQMRNPKVLDYLTTKIEEIHNSASTSRESTPHTPKTNHSPKKSHQTPEKLNAVVAKLLSEKSKLDATNESPKKALNKRMSGNSPEKSCDSKHVAPIVGKNNKSPCKDTFDPVVNNTPLKSLLKIIPIASSGVKPNDWSSQVKSMLSVNPAACNKISSPVIADILSKCPKTCVKNEFESMDGIEPTASSKDTDMNGNKEVKSEPSDTKDLMANKEQHLQEGQEVLARWNDGLYYLGSILLVDNKQLKCYIRFEDGSEYWSLFKDIQTEAKDDECDDDINCSICQSEVSDKPNEIVLCDNCGLGFHQQCHSPAINSDVLKPDVSWLCRQCIFATTAKKGGAVKNGPDAQALQAMKQCLPYDINKLVWDRCHKNNLQRCYCYCGGPGDWYMKMLQCCRCKQWFHEACTQCLDHPLVYGDRFYVFVCTLCNSGPEYIKRLYMKWSDVAHLALFNLTIQHNKKYYDLNDDILPWLNDNWERLQLHKLQETTRGNREVRIEECLTSGNKTKFAWGRDIKRKQTHWGLKVRVPPAAPSIILPEDGQITDEIMNSLQMKGKKTISFLPVQGDTPVPLRNKRKLSDGRLELESNKARKLLMDATTKNVEENPISPNQNYLGYAGNMDVFEFHDEDDKTKERTPEPENVLDKLIPRPSTFDGLNHPFKTILEKNDERDKIRIKRKILNWYQNGCSDDLDLSSQDEPIFGSSTADNFSWSDISSSHDTKTGLLKNGTISKSTSVSSNQPETKPRRGRKRKSEVLRLQALAALEAEEAKKRAQHAAQLAKEAKKREQHMKQIENKVKHYLCSSKAANKREGFQVLARRMTPDGKVQYLVQWEGIIS